MSDDLKQIAGTVIGATIGFLTTGTLVGAVRGAQIGFLLGSAFTEVESETQQTPTLDDKQAQVSEYGEFIPRVYSEVELKGNIIWQKGNQLFATEINNQEGGKTGTEGYTATFALMICEGPVSRIRRIHADSRLIFDGFDDSSAIAATDRINMNFFFGTDDQPQSISIVKEKGIDSTPAYRNVVYIVFNDFEVTEHYHGRIPSFRVETQTDLLTSSNNLTQGFKIVPYSSQYPKNFKLGIPHDNTVTERPWHGDVDTMISLNFGQSGAVGNDGYSDFIKDALGNSISIDVDIPWIYKNTRLLSTLSSGVDPITQTVAKLTRLTFNNKIAPPNWVVLRTYPVDNGKDVMIHIYRHSSGIGKQMAISRGIGYFNKVTNVDITGSALNNDTARFFSSGSSSTTYIHLRNGRSDEHGSDVNFFVVQSSSPLEVPGSFSSFGKQLTPALDWQDEEELRAPGAIATYHAVGVDSTFYHFTEAFLPGSGLSTVSNPIGYNHATRSIDQLTENTLAVIDSWDISAHLPASTVDIDPMIVVRQKDDIEFYMNVNEGGNRFVKHFRLDPLNVGFATLVESTQLTLNNNWDAQNLIDLSPQTSYITGDPASFSDDVRFQIGFDSIAVSTAKSDLADIIQEEILSNPLLTANDIDTSEVDAVFVRGYAVTRLGSFAAAIKPLQRAFRFDMFEEDYKIKFRSRGSQSVRVNIPLSDLQAREKGGDVPAEVLHKLPAAFETPNRLEFRFIDADLDYRRGFVYADSQRSTSVAVSNFQVPVKLTQTEAAQMADILIRDAERDGNGTYELILPMKYSYLERTDIIGVTASWGVLTLRITSIEKGKPGLVKIGAVEEDATAYTSVEVGQDDTFVTSSIRPVPSTELVVFEANMGNYGNRSENRGGGMYYAIRPLGNATNWKGATIHIQDVASGTWEALSALTFAITPMGIETLLTPLTGDASISRANFDQTLTIQMENLTIENRTPTEIFSPDRLNTFIYGDNKRQEVIGVESVTDLGNDQYELTGLWRGMYGSEASMSTHQPGDAIVYVATEFLNTLSRSNRSSLSVGNGTFNWATGRFVTLPNASLPAPAWRSPQTIGLEAVSIGHIQTGSTNQLFEFESIKELPFSPTFVRLKFDINGGIYVIFRRATRKGAIDGSIFKNKPTELPVDLDIFDGSGELLRTISRHPNAFSSTFSYLTNNTQTTTDRTAPDPTLDKTGGEFEEVFYSPADQITDFGVLQSSLNFDLYNLSMELGRGWPCRVVENVQI